MDNEFEGAANDFFSDFYTPHHSKEVSSKSRVVRPSFAPSPRSSSRSTRQAPLSTGRSADLRSTRSTVSTGESILSSYHGPSQSPSSSTANAGSSFFRSSTMRPLSSPSHHHMSVSTNASIAHSLPPALARSLSLTSDRVLYVNTSLMITDYSHLEPVDQHLAHDYILEGSDAASVCEFNRRASLARGRHDLAQAWELASLITNPQLLQQRDYFFPWTHHPFGRLARNLMEQFRQAGDIQTVALLSCVFSFPGGNPPLSFMMNMD